MLETLGLAAVIMFGVVSLQTFWISRSIDRISALIEQSAREHEDFREQILELHKTKADKQEARQ